MNTVHLIEGAILALAVVGLTWLLHKLRDGLGRMWEWARRDRVAELLGDQDPSGLCQGCWDGRHCDGADDLCSCTCGWSEDWAEEGLPAERSREELGFTGDQPATGYLRGYHAKIPVSLLKAAEEERAGLRMVDDTFWGIRPWNAYDELAAMGRQR